jgi:hypothetical protein
MTVRAFVERWGSVISLVLFSVVWASLQLDVLRGLATEGLSAVDTLSDGGMLVMLLITLGMTGYAVRQTLTEGAETI